MQSRMTESFDFSAIRRSVQLAGTFLQFRHDFEKHDCMLRMFSLSGSLQLLRWFVNEASLAANRSSAVVKTQPVYNIHVCIQEHVCACVYVCMCLCVCVVCVCTCMLCACVCVCVWINGR